MENPIKEIINKKDVKSLVKLFFDIKLTPKQEEIVRIIAYSEHKRVVISAMTRWGKSMSVSLGILLYILFNENKKIRLIAPTYDQTSILRNYIAENIVKCSLLMEILEIETRGVERIKKEVSKKRMTFKNGCEFMLLSAEGEAKRLLGFGGDLIVLDEGCLIDEEVYRTKISRMLGDRPNSTLIEIGNPWNRDNQMWKHWIDPKFKKIHISWKKALEEKRTTNEFIEEQRERLTSREFQILYEAEFPEESEDSLFKLRDIQNSFKAPINIQKGTKIISCDVADRGGDRTVIMKGFSKNNRWQITEVYAEDVSDNMQVAGRIVNKHKEFKADRIHIDRIGVGAGVLSRVKEVLKNSKVKVKGCHFGETANNSDRFLNQKAENYFKLKEIFGTGRIKIIPNKWKDYIINDLTKMKWELTSAGKVKIIDPDKSPDFADALVYFIWSDKKELVFDFI